ncbi:phage tail protein [Sphingomonas sp. NPDC092331]|jgi:microcystin-dependent protein|uniref:phage tail protein n=1 Tax=unclassified Sphingomonas TaxID=196159 RepID=UPI0031F501B3
MSEPFIGQIMQVGFNFAPRGWAPCQGQIMSIQQNTALFSLLGTVYGGNGQSTFGLPDSRGRVFIGQGNGPGLTPITLGEIGGVNSEVLSILQMPIHNHLATFTPTGGGTVSGTLQAMTGAIGSETAIPAAGSFLGVANDSSGSITPTFYVPAGQSGTTPVNLGGLNITGGGGGTGTVTVANSGGSQPVPVMQPYLGIQTNIALEGVFPSRN